MNRSGTWPTSLEEVHGEVVDFMIQRLGLRRLFAEGHIDEEAMLGLASNAEEQGVLGDVPVSSSDDGRIQLRCLTLTHLRRSKPTESPVGNRAFSPFLLKSCKNPPHLYERLPISIVP